MYEKIFIIGGILEITLRLLPTKRNFSLIDLVKKIVDIIPNKRIK